MFNSNYRALLRFTDECEWWRCTGAEKEGERLSVKVWLNFSRLGLPISFASKVFNKWCACQRLKEISHTLSPKILSHLAIYKHITTSRAYPSCLIPESHMVFQIAARAVSSLPTYVFLWTSSRFSIDFIPNEEYYGNNFYCVHFVFDNLWIQIA